MSIARDVVWVCLAPHMVEVYSPHIYINGPSPFIGNLHQHGEEIFWDSSRFKLMWTPFMLQTPTTP